MHVHVHMSRTMSQAMFKTCACCGRTWPTRDEFIVDPSLLLNGYQANFESQRDGLFYFTHMSDGCGSTMVIPAYEFLDMYSGPRYPEQRALSAECPGYCLDKSQLDRCTVHCECAFAREVVQIIRETPKDFRKSRI